MPGGGTDLPCRERSGFRVRQDRLGVVVGEGVLKPRLDGALGRWICSGVDTDALFPQAEVPKDTLEHLALVDEGYDAHFARADRAQERVGFPHLLDELAPFCRGDAARFVLGDVDDLYGLASSCGSLLGGVLVALASHLVRIPTVVPDELEALVRDVLSDRCDEVARGEDLEVALKIFGLRPER